MSPTAKKVWLDYFRGADSAVTAIGTLAVCVGLAGHRFVGPRLNIDEKPPRNIPVPSTAME